MFRDQTESLGSKAVGVKSIHIAMDSMQNLKCKTISITVRKGWGQCNHTQRYDVGAFEKDAVANPVVPQEPRLCRRRLDTLNQAENIFLRRKTATKKEFDNGILRELRSHKRG